MNVDEKGKGTKVIRAKLAQKEGKQRWSNIKITGILDVASPHGNRRYKDKIVGIFPVKNKSTFSYCNIMPCSWGNEYVILNSGTHLTWAFKSGK